MRPRFPQGAQAELQEVSDLLGRTVPTTAPPHPKQSQSNKGAFWKWLFIFSMFALASNWLSRPQPQAPTSSFGEARPNDAQPLPISPAPTPVPAVAEPPAPRAELVRAEPTVPSVPRAALVNLGTPHIPDHPISLGDTTWVQMPDGRWVVATFVGVAARESDLPPSGNRLGDARYVGQHCFVWLRPIGQTNPTWIDP